MRRILQWALGILILGLALAPATAAWAAPQRSTYVVQPGDTLMRIAARHRVTVSQLAAANGLRWNAWVYTGQRLTIPGTPAQPAPSPRSGTYIVRPGDTLMSIAARHGITIRQLAATNGLPWNSWLYVGQRLTIPGAGSPGGGQPAPSNPPSSGGGTYVVKAGNTLFSIARWHGTTVSALRSANGLSSNTIYVGQRLTIPGGSDGSPPSNTPAPTPKPPPSHGGAGEKWIDIDLSEQRVTAYEGRTAVYSAIASTGTRRTPTVVGTYHVYAKYRYTGMSGPGYNLPNVPHTMYFYRGYAIHGAYWHNNFGTPMSHGCVNLSLPDAEWFYNWAPMGIKVVSHH
jgi:LysM repeat protein